MSQSIRKSRRLFAALKEKYGKLDILVHAVAYAPAEDLRGEFINTSREGFRIAQDVSVYSLIAVTRAAAPLMTESGSVMTLSYYAAEKVVPNYNVMAVAKASLECTVRYLAWNLGPKNIRVNAISAGPIKTLAARGVGALGEMMKSHADRAPAASQCGPARSWRSGAVSGQRSIERHHRRSALRGLRLQRHGLLRRGKKTPRSRRLLL